VIGPVAIASENDEFDAEVYRALLALVLGDEVTRWPTDMRFTGWQSVEKQLDLYLARAAERGVRHALIGVDNDGGARRHPEHVESHDPGVHAEDPDGCCECWLRSIVPQAWRESGGQECVVVPVQCIETWLLWLRGDPLEPSPEAVYGRRTLKTRFLGKPTPPLTQRTKLALAQIERPDALARLRERPSFVRFEAQVLAWGR
jgi:hypothetical protein